MQAFPIMLPTAGVKLDFPSQFLLPQYSPDSQNMEYWEGFLRTRLGLRKMFLESFEGNPIMLIFQFWKKSGSWWLVICTTEDIYFWDIAANTRRFITPIYNVGTVNVTNNSNIVTGVNTVWLTNTKAGDRFRLGGLNDANPVWYRVASVNSNTQITLTTVYAQANAAGQAYTIRKVFTGSAKDYWKATVFEDGILGEVLILTNGRVNNLVRWRGSTLDATVIPLGGDPPRAQLMEVFKNRVILFDTIEGGLNERQRVRWSAVGNCESWPATNFNDLAEEQDWIMDKGIIGDKIIIFKEINAYIMRWVGGDEVFRFEQRTDITGAFSRNSAISSRHGIYYWGRDNRFYHFNGISSKSISDDILPFTVDINPNEEIHIFGEYVEYLNQFRWFVTHGDATKNNHCVVYDLNVGIWEIWRYTHTEALNVMGWYLVEQDLFVDDPVWGELFVSETEGYWDSRIFLQGAPIVLYGGYDGFIRRADIGNDDDGFPYEKYFRSKKIDYELPHFDKRLYRIQPWFNRETIGSVNLRTRLGDENAWRDAGALSLHSPTENVVKPNSRILDFNSDVFEFEFRSFDYFEFLGFLSMISRRKRTF